MEIGQKVKVYRLRDRVSSPIAKKLGQVGVIQGYKVIDAGIGVVVLFEDNSSTWFFEDEIKPV
ncbi:cytochrome B6 [Nostoc calcicola FACHB-389]|nr:DUF2862 domain-containing protein [Nostoc calcicola FACHB-3891]OKH32000.1 cytochrome B6 [Nostoc calcicola FACHB-389]